MNREFRHRGTGEVVKTHEHSGGEYYIDVNFDLTPKRFIEDSSEWEEVKKVLYTTYDGVERYEFQREYWVINDKYIPAHKFPICEGHLEGSLSNPETWKIFSTEEAAKEYVFMNEPLLSLNDLLSVWNKVKDDFDVKSDSPLFQNFLKLAKTK